MFQSSHSESACIVFQYEDGEIEAATESNSYIFSPIKTEAEKRRDESYFELYNLVNQKGGGTLHSWCRTVIDAGWIKPKPLTEAIIEYIVENKLKEVCTVNYLRVAKAIEAYIRGDEKELTDDN